MNKFTFLGMWLIMPGVVFADAATPWQIGFQDPATPIMEQIISFHHHIMFFVTIVLTFVFYMFTRLFILFKEANTSTERSNISHGTTIEIIWTLTPSLILVLIAIPSFALLYAMDEPIDPKVTVKAIGHQWYWTYEYSDYKTPEGKNAISFDSYMVPEDELKEGDLRLLEVDNQLVLPTNTHVNIVITATDVLHSWCVPSLGIKMDAVPGRLNQTFAFIQREGVFYGQCSEICGVNHGFMPIVVKSVPLHEYIEWVNEQIEA